MAHYTDYLVDQVKSVWTEVGTSGANAAVTVTHAAAASRHHVVFKCHASYDASTGTGLLQISFGSDVIAHKDIHGAGEIDFGQLGHQNSDANEAVSATLAAGGGSAVGHVTLIGYTTGTDA